MTAKVRSRTDCKPIAKFYFEIVGPNRPYCDGLRAEGSPSFTFELLWPDGFTAQGMRRLNELVHAELGGIICGLSTEPWGSSKTIKRVYKDEPSYRKACESVARFVDRHSSVA